MTDEEKTKQPLPQQIDYSVGELPCLSYTRVKTNTSGMVTEQIVLTAKGGTLPECEDKMNYLLNLHLYFEGKREQPKEKERDNSIG